MSQFYHVAIRNLHPNVGVVVDDVAYDKDSNEIISVDPQKLSQEIDRLEAEYDSKQYQRDRAVAYDPIPEHLDQIYHDIDGWKAKIKAVKDKYPKPK